MHKCLVGYPTETASVDILDSFTQIHEAKILIFLNKFLKAGKTKSGFGNKKGDNNAKGNIKTQNFSKSSCI